MNISKVITPAGISLDLKGKTKQAIIEELLDLLIVTEQVQDRTAALKAVLEREAKMSTGMQHGLALPHAKTDTVTRLVGVLGIQRAGIDFHSLDGQPSTLFILTLSPLSRTGPHIQFLAEIGRLLSNQVLRDRLLQATTQADVTAVLQTPVSP